MEGKKLLRTWHDITNRFPVNIDLGAMRADLKALENERWLEHYDPTLSRGWLAVPLVSLDGKMGDPEDQRPGRGFDQFKRTPVLDKLPYFKWFLDQIKAPMGRVRILKLMPGASIGKHRDVAHEVANLAFKQVRLHIPIYTNPEVYFHVGNERIYMREGRLYYVNFSKVHWVKNGGNEPRTHLVMDLQVNEWLDGSFPAATMPELLQQALDRAFLPAFWRARQRWVKAGRVFWNNYEGSAAQRVVRRIRGKA